MRAPLNDRVRVATPPETIAAYRNGCRIARGVVRSGLYDGCVSRLLGRGGNWDFCICRRNARSKPSGARPVEESPECRRCGGATTSISLRICRRSDRAWPNPERWDARRRGGIVVVAGAAGRTAYDGLQAPRRRPGLSAASLRFCGLPVQRSPPQPSRRSQSSDLVGRWAHCYPFLAPTT